MKVVQVLYSGLGGHGNVAFSLQQMASRAGAWESAMIFLGIEPLLPDYQRMCTERSLSLQFVRGTRGAPWRSWWALYRALSRMQPQAIILHSVKTILPCWLYARLRGIPIIAVEHQSNELKTVAERRVSRLLMWLADAVVVLTPQYREALKAVVGACWRSDKVHVIPNGIDTAPLSPRSVCDDVPRRPKLIGMASRFSAIKRHDVLVGALALLRRQDGVSAWRLTLAGDGETHADVQRLCRELGIIDAVDFPGCLDERTLFDWFKTLDVYVQASDGETLSTSVLQAMSLGLPIVGSNVPGIDSLLSAGEGCGLLVEVQTPEAFAHAFHQLADAPSMAAVFGARARALAETKYSQDIMFKGYQQLLDRCLR